MGFYTDRFSIANFIQGSPTHWNKIWILGSYLQICSIKTKFSRFRPSGGRADQCRPAVAEYWEIKCWFWTHIQRHSQNSSTLWRTNLITSCQNQPTCFKCCRTEDTSVLPDTNLVSTGHTEMIFSSSCKTRYFIRREDGRDVTAIDYKVWSHTEERETIILMLCGNYFS
jgi:hypothetical protein